MMRLTWLLLLAPSCFGYISQVTADSQQTPLTRSDNAGIQFYLSDKVVPGVQSSASGPTVTVISSDSNPQQAIHAALATWNAVSTANVNFLSLKSTSLGINSSDKQMTIAIASSSSDVSTVGGALAVTIDSYTVPGGVIVDSDIIVSASKQFSTTGAANTFDLQAVMTHELGHSLGANHTGILGATMFQYNTPVQRQLSSDDLAFLNAMYPSTTSPVSFGGISGKVTITGTAGSALLTMVDTGTGATFGGVSAGDGTFTVKVPAGTYQMYAEPLNGVVQPVNLYFSPQLTAGSLQSTMFSGTVTVTANNTATANVTANSAPSPPLLVVPNIAIIAHNSTQLPGQFPQGGPVFVPSGGQGGLVDLLMYGTGIDATLSAGNFAILGQGVTVNSVGQVPNLSPFTLRVTLNVASQQSLSLASIFITKGSSTLTLSGALVIGPPTPTTTSQSIINSASYAGGVSPGGIYALFDIPGAPNLGPAVAVGNSGHYDPYGFLASTLGGVTVTFDGVPAPLFFVYGGQINLQVPFEVAGKTSTKMVVSYLGSPSTTIQVPVVAVQPAFFTADSSGKGEVSAANFPDYSINSAQNPIAAPGIVEIYGTGVGKVSYSVVTGQGAPAFPSGFTGNYTYTVGNSAPANALFGGWTPGFVGLAQWDLQIPAGTPSGPVSIKVTDTATGASSQAGTTIYVK